MSFLENNRAQIATLGGIQTLLKAIKKYYRANSNITRKAFRALFSLIIDGIFSLSLFCFLYLLNLFRCLDANKDIFTAKSGIEVVQEAIRFFLNKDPCILLLLFLIVKSLCKHSLLLFLLIF